MAKKSKIARNKQREEVVARYAEKRAELKKTLVDPNATDEAREAARVGLQKLPATRRPCACVAATPSTVAPAATCRSSASRASVSATWRTRASCPV